MGVLIETVVVVILHPTDGQRDMLTISVVPDLPEIRANDTITIPDKKVTFKTWYILEESVTFYIQSRLFLVGMEIVCFWCFGINRSAITKYSTPKIITKCHHVQLLLVVHPLQTWWRPNIVCTVVWYVGRHAFCWINVFKNCTEFNTTMFVPCT